MSHSKHHHNKHHNHGTTHHEHHGHHKTSHEKLEELRKSAKKNALIRSELPLHEQAFKEGDVGTGLLGSGRNDNAISYGEALKLEEKWKGAPLTRDEKSRLRETFISKVDGELHSKPIVDLVERIRSQLAANYDLHNGRLVEKDSHAHDKVKLATDLPRKKSDHKLIAKTN